MTTNQQIQGDWLPRPLEWGPAKHQASHSDSLGTNSSSVETGHTHDEKPDDN